MAGISRFIAISAPSALHAPPLSATLRNQLSIGVNDIDG